ncbi:hypothetical protein cce_4450 [Crocosphaera subtropica ATCC 51142]|uniref:PEP-CTERM protein-sorting domain-containing protein n=1 Tax=Crocosphaera subtropica (strain ATCC 51142 / BH68) TaxID=43989 RepID=B1WUE4_CROS5|nr:PEP-CTERM sorting domain-containing protein [Crocosphaera subtropica]ACB53798.1 hypothetical protein cce_4450 [Crocosphaera subtropica ATCC 51142]
MKHLLKTFSVAIATGMVALSFPSVANAFTMSSTPGFYDEALDGYDDLSDNRLDPTDLGSLIPGVNKLRASFFNDGGVGLDYFTFTVDKGQALKAIVLNDWEVDPFEDIAFIAIQKGDTFTFEFPNDNVADGLGALGLLGWSHLRSTQVGTNKILEEMAISNLTPENGGIDEAYFQAEVDEGFYEGLDNQAALEQSLRDLALPRNSQAGATGFDRPLKAGTYSMWLRQGNANPISVELDFETVSVPEPTGVLGTTVAFGLMTLLRKKSKRS